MHNTNPSWLKYKGYRHISGHVDVQRRSAEVIAKISNAKFISKYAFFPLIHTSLIERRYKYIQELGKRVHSYKDETGNIKKTAKPRPLHYANHFDALIYGYYANFIQNKYEEKINDHIGLSRCVIAYRKIPSEVQGKNKGTIHFAKEVFEEIKKRAEVEENCKVLTFDIKSFFSSLDHEHLKKMWAIICDFTRLPDDHYNVYKAATQFSYFLLDDLRLKSAPFSGRRGFDEKELAKIRNNYGVDAFFSSPKVFRDKIKSGDLKLYKYPFRNKARMPMGIPQGLPISATLANIYLFQFDLDMLNKVVSKYGAFYRRYSDDVVVVCKEANADIIEKLVYEKLRIAKVEPSVEKTEKYLFKYMPFSNEKSEVRLTCCKINGDIETPGGAFNYLGFAFNGYNTQIKSANLAKFYRRMLSSVSRKANRAKKLAESSDSKTPIIFRNQLKKLYITKNLRRAKSKNRWKRLIANNNGTFTLKSGINNKKLRNNYISYVKKASEIMKSPTILNQIRNRKRIFNDAIKKILSISKQDY